MRRIVNHYLNKSVIVVAGLFLLGCSSQQQEEDKNQQANIIYIKSDDHAYQAISAYGYGINETVKVRIKIGDTEVEKECYPGASEVRLILELKKGEAKLQTWFYEEDGNSFGVPFLYFERL